ncbi:MAG: ATP-binding cassette domain-containing protein [Gemmatimonadales bacterium]|nr:ATP-binding cassette domain-containing protein [Gemmatimonadales bacterium]
MRGSTPGSPASRRPRRPRDDRKPSGDHANRGGRIHRGERGKPGETARIRFERCVPGGPWRERRRARRVSRARAHSSRNRWQPADPRPRQPPHHSRVLGRGAAGNDRYPKPPRARLRDPRRRRAPRRLGLRPDRRSTECDDGNCRQRWSPACEPRRRARCLVGSELLPRPRRPGRAGQSVDDPGGGVRFRGLGSGTGCRTDRASGRRARLVRSGTAAAGGARLGAGSLDRHQPSCRPRPAVGGHLGRRWEPGGGRRLRAVAARPRPAPRHRPGCDRSRHRSAHCAYPAGRGAAGERGRRSPVRRSGGRRNRPRRDLRTRARRPRLPLVDLAGDVSRASSPTAEPIFAAEGFAKRFGASEVLRAASVQAWPGRVTLLLGRNGSGKSTLLRCALGLLGAETGSVRWRGRATLRPRVARMAREGLCFVPDAGLAVPDRRVHAHLATLASAFPEARRLTDLDPLDVSPFLDSRVRELSGGERRRVELTFGLLRNPLCLIADEPLTGLAPADQQRAVHALRDAAGRGAAVLITGHEVELLMQAADEVVWITAGGTRVMGTPEQTWRHPEFVRDYLGRRARTEMRTGSKPHPEGADRCQGGEVGSGKSSTRWSSRLRRIWLPMAGAAAGIWVVVRLVMAAFGVTTGTLLRSGDGTLSLWAAGVSVPVVGVCVVLSWLNHLRRGDGPFLSALGVSHRPAFIAWAATCSTLELVAAALLAVV